jgi:hypothetical protein
MDTTQGPRGEIVRQRRAFLRSGLTLAPAVLATQLLSAQYVPQQEESPDTRLPNGRKQTDMILKSDYEQNIKDARELSSLAKSIELDFDKNDQNVLSLGLLKKLDDVEKITKRIRARLRRN